MRKIIIELAVAFSSHEIAKIIVICNERILQEYEIIQFTSIFSDFFDVGIVPVQREFELTLFPVKKLHDCTLHEFEKLCGKIHKRFLLDAQNFLLEEIAITPLPVKPIDLQKIHTKQLIERSAEIAFHARHKKPPQGEDAKFYRKITQLACKHQKRVF